MISLFLIFMLLLVAAVAYFHFTQGLFSAVISAILAGFSAVLAIGWHETVVEALLGGQLGDYAHGIMLMLMFGAIYLALRLIFDKVVPGNMTFPNLVNKIGGAAAGVVAGVFAAGTCAIAAQMMPFMPGMLGYARYDIAEDRDITPPAPPGGKKPEPIKAFDMLTDNGPFHDLSGKEAKLVVPVDDVVLGIATNLSESGALSTSTPLTRMHPDWLMELFGQRLGIETKGRRVALNLGAKQTDVSLAASPEQPGAGVYLLNPTEPLKRHNADFDAVHTAKGDFLNIQDDAKTGKVTIVVRAYFGEKAKDRTLSVIQLSPASARLVARQPASGGATKWTNTYPRGTLEWVDDADDVSPLERNAMFYFQRADDFIVIDDQTGGEVEKSGLARRQDPAGKFNVGNKAIDLVYTLNRDGFVVDQGPGKAPVIADGTFLEIKRLGRVNLGGMPLISATAKLRAHPAVGPTRKTWVKANEPRSPDALLTELSKSTWEAQGEAPFLLRISKTAAGTFNIALQPKPGVPGPNVGSPITPVTGLGKDKAVVLLSSLKLKPDAPSFGRTLIDASNLELGQLALSPESGETLTFNKVDAQAPTPPPDNPPDPTPAPTDPAPQPTDPANPTPTPTPTPANPVKPPPAKPAAPAVPFSVPDQDSPVNRKFPLQLGVPGELTDDVELAGGKVTLVEGEDAVGQKEWLIRKIAVPAVAEATLQGAGRRPEKLSIPEGNSAIQIVVAPAPGTQGWEWAKVFDTMVAVDTDGNKHEPRGVFVNFPGDKLLARFDADARVTLADAAPAGRPTKITFVFIIPSSARIASLNDGADKKLHAFPNPIPE